MRNSTRPEDYEDYPVRADAPECGAAADGNTRSLAAVELDVQLSASAGKSNSLNSTPISSLQVTTRGQSAISGSVKVYGMHRTDTYDGRQRR